MAELPGLLSADENYNSASDGEFDPDTVVAAEESSSSDTNDESNTRASERKTKTKRKRDAPNDGELDSGDEATITAAQKKRRTGKKDASGEDEDLHLSDADGGEGCLVKTRAQRRKEQKERRPLADTDGATADIDAIWSKLASAPVAKPPKPSPPAAPANGDVQQLTGTNVAATAPEDEETITIKRTYDFAGDRITEERQVPKNSAEARLYLTQQEAHKQHQDQQLSERKSVPRSSASATPPPDGSPATASNDGKPKVRRPLRRPSRFDPNPTGQVKGLPPDKQLTWDNRRRLLDTTLAALSPVSHAIQGDGMTPAESAALAGGRRLDKAQKLNTVDKSRLDWAGYVDREGIADELDEYGRAKEGYLGRMDFLSRVDERRDAERKAAKMKGVGA